MSIEDAILKLAESQNRTNQLIESRMNRPGVVARGAAAVGRGVTSVATAPARLASATVRGVTAPLRIAAAGAANVATAPYRLAAGVTRTAGSAAAAPFRAMGGLFGGGTTKALNNLSDVVAKEKTQKLLLEQVELFRSEFLSEMKRMREKNLDALEDRRERGKESSIGSRPGAGQVSTDETKDKKGFNIPWKKLLGGIAGLATSVVVAKKAFDLFKGDVDTKPTTGETPEETARRQREAKAATAQNEKRMKAAQKLRNLDTRFNLASTQKIGSDLDEIVKDTNTSAGNAYRTTKASTLASGELDESPFDKAARKNSEAAQRKRIANAYGQMGANRAEGARISRIANAYGQMGANRAEGARIARIANAYGQMGTDRAMQERIAIAEGRVPANLDEVPSQKVESGRFKSIATTGLKTTGKVLSTSARIAGPAGAFVEGVAAFGNAEAKKEGSTSTEVLVANLASLPSVFSDIVNTGINSAFGTKFKTTYARDFTQAALEGMRDTKEKITGDASFGQMEGAVKLAERVDQMLDGSKPGAYEMINAGKEQEREKERQKQIAREELRRFGIRSQVGEVNRLDARDPLLSQSARLVESLRFGKGIGVSRKLLKTLGLTKDDYVVKKVVQRDKNNNKIADSQQLELTESGIQKLASTKSADLEKLNDLIENLLTKQRSGVSQAPYVDASSRQNVSNTSNTTVLSGSAPSTVNVYDNMF